MPIYFFWGEDDFTLNLAVREIRDQVVETDWVSFNYDKISGTEKEGIINALNQAMSPVFGMGGRLVWLYDTNIGQQCPPELMTELTRTLPQIPPETHLILSSHKKPDGRIKSTKLLQKHGIIREFTLLAPWETEAIRQKVAEKAKELRVKLQPEAVEFLATCVGNQTRQLHMELEKLSLYQQSQNVPLTVEAIAPLINSTTANSLQLATAIRQGNSLEATRLVQELLSRNEPPLKVVATLVGQFRTWTMLKIILETGESNNQTIADFAGIRNPKRIYFLRQEIKDCQVSQLLQTLPVLLDLEFRLKQGTEASSSLKKGVLELVSLFSRP